MVVCSRDLLWLLWRLCHGESSNVMKKMNFLNHFGESHLLNLASTSVPGHILKYVEKHVHFNGIICSSTVSTMVLAKMLQSLYLALSGARFE